MSADRSPWPVTFLQPTLHDGTEADGQRLGLSYRQAKRVWRRYRNKGGNILSFAVIIWRIVIGQLLGQWLRPGNAGCDTEFSHRSNKDPRSAPLGSKAS